MYAHGTDPRAIVSVLSDNLEKFNDWCTENGLPISANKTQFMFFHKANDTKFRQVPELYLNGTKIERVFSFKYLGIYIEPTFSFMKHYDKVNSRVSSCLGKLYGVRKHLPVKVNKILIKACSLCL